MDLSIRGDHSVVGSIRKLDTEAKKVMVLWSPPSSIVAVSEPPLPSVVRKLRLKQATQVLSRTGEVRFGG
jgi:hypothetical protein